MQIQIVPAIVGLLWWICSKEIIKIKIYFKISSSFFSFCYILKNNKLIQNLIWRIKITYANIYIHVYIHTYIHLCIFLPNDTLFSLWSNTQILTKKCTVVVPENQLQWIDNWLTPVSSQHAPNQAWRATKHLACVRAWSWNSFGIKNWPWKIVYSSSCSHYA